MIFAEMDHAEEDDGFGMDEERALKVDVRRGSGCWVADVLAGQEI